MKINVGENKLIMKQRNTLMSKLSFHHESYVSIFSHVLFDHVPVLTHAHIKTGLNK